MVLVFGVDFGADGKRLVGTGAPLVSGLLEVPIPLVRNLSEEVEVALREGDLAVDELVDVV